VSNDVAVIIMVIARPYLIAGIHVSLILDGGGGSGEAIGGGGGGRGVGPARIRTFLCPNSLF